MFYSPQTERDRSFIYTVLLQRSSLYEEKIDSTVCPAYNEELHS